MDGQEDIKVSKEEIVIENGKAEKNKMVMHVGEDYLMKKFAEIGTANGGHILEIGFGMHLSADAVQSNPNVLSHTIIEIHPIQYERAIEWGKLQKKEVTVIFGDWIDVLPLKDKKFDGIIHDTHLDTNIPKFLDYVKDNCKDGTIVAFFEYNKFDPRINGLRVSIPKDEWETIPYKDNIYFKDNQFELKYTTFNGEDFYRKKVLDKLL